MGLMDSFKIRAALSKHQKGDIRGRSRTLISQGIMKPNFLLPYSVLLLRDGGDEKCQKVKNLLAKIQRSPELSKDERSQLLMNYAVADWKLGNRDKAVKLLESAHRDHPTASPMRHWAFSMWKWETPSKRSALTTKPMSMTMKTA